jgi:monofunctional biosynthetic peptidoglycan transglycosylase
MRAGPRIIPPDSVEGEPRLPEAAGSVKPPAAENGGDAAAASRGRPRIAPKIWRWLIGLAMVPILLLLCLVALYRFAPPVSTLMLARILTHRPVDRQWVPLERISPSLQAAVIMSEDGQFCRHHGVDWAALAEVVADITHGGPVRGASTLSMQTAKNLFLWPTRSYLRKGLEIPLALLIDFAWGKQRMLEIYLNIAQWGGGTFGAEAAARHYFNMDAADLTPREAALMAAALPDPRDRNAARPSRRLSEVAAIVQKRLAESHSHLACLPQAQAAMEQAAD